MQRTTQDALAIFGLCDDPRGNTALAARGLISPDLNRPCSAFVREVGDDALSEVSKIWPYARKGDLLFLTVDGGRLCLQGPSALLFDERRNPQRGGASLRLVSWNKYHPESWTKLSAPADSGFRHKGCVLWNGVDPRKAHSVIFAEGESDFLTRCAIAEDADTCVFGVYAGGWMGEGLTFGVESERSAGKEARGNAGTGIQYSIKTERVVSQRTIAILTHRDTAGDGYAHKIMCGIHEWSQQRAYEVLRPVKYARSDFSCEGLWDYARKHIADDSSADQTDLLRMGLFDGCRRDGLSVIAHTEHVTWTPPPPAPPPAPPKRKVIDPAGNRYSLGLLDHFLTTATGGGYDGDRSKCAADMMKVANACARGFLDRWDCESRILSAYVVARNRKQNDSRRKLVKDVFTRACGSV